MTKTTFKQIGIGCGAIVANDKDEILLVKRSLSSRHEPGTWSRPGGKIEFGETIESALAREILEETGIQIQAIEFLEVSQSVDPENDFHWISLGYFAWYSSGTARNMEPDRHDEVAWFPLDQLPPGINAITRRAIRTFLEKRDSIKKPGELLR